MCLCWHILKSKTPVYISLENLQCWIYLLDMGPTDNSHIVQAGQYCIKFCLPVVKAYSIIWIKTNYNINISLNLSHPLSSTDDKNDDALEGWVVSSESCTFHSIGARYYREVQPGEIVQINKHGVKTLAIVPRAEKEPPAFCIFEYVYFSRPDTVYEGNCWKCAEHNKPFRKLRICQRSRKIIVISGAAIVRKNW